MALINFLTNPAARQDVKNFISKPNLRSAAGIAGTIFSLPEFKVSEAKAYDGGTYPESGQVQGITNNSGFDQNLSGLSFTPDGGGNTGGGGGGGGGVATQSQGDTGGSFVDPYGPLRDDISSSWDNYLGSLDNQLYGLEGQRTAQEGIANSQFNQGVNTLDLQKIQGLNQLATQRGEVEQNQAKNLRDIAANLKNSFMAGNIYLGSRGAGDSSAANQYAFALTKMGSRQRGDIMNNTSNILKDIGARETNLNNIYNIEKNNLQESLNQQISGIAQWYQNAVNQIQMQKSQGLLSKGQDLASLTKDALNYALGQLQTLQQQAASRQSMLDQWATSNAKTLGELKTNFSTISSPSYQLPQAQAFAGAPQFTSDGRIFVPSGYGSNSEEQKRTLFG